MRRGTNNPWGGPLEYILLIILLLLVLITIFSLFWPALKLFYEQITQN